MADLDAAIRDWLATMHGNRVFDNAELYEESERAEEALRRVVVECDRCERGGTMMSPSIVRSLIAAALGVPQAGKP